MMNSLLLAFVLMFSAGLAHLIIWRIRRPLAYLFWLPAIFIATPIAIVLILMIIAAQDPGQGFTVEVFSLAYNQPWSVIAGLLLYFSISACYTGGYAGIVEYSPSAEILQEVERHMPEGIMPELLEVSSLSEQALTGKRIHHLVASGLVAEIKNKLRLTSSGKRITSFWKLYRKVFGIKLGK
jgi:hypothetical protein